MSTQSKESIVFHNLWWPIFTLFYRTHSFSLEYVSQHTSLLWLSGGPINHHIHLSIRICKNWSWTEKSSRFYWSCQKTHHLDPLKHFDHWLAMCPLQKQPKAFSILWTSVVLWIYKNSHTWCWQSARCPSPPGLTWGASPQILHHRWTARGTRTSHHCWYSWSAAPQVHSECPLWPVDTAFSSPRSSIQ